MKTVSKEGSNKIDECVKQYVKCDNREEKYKMLEGFCSSCEEKEQEIVFEKIFSQIMLEDTPVTPCSPLDSFALLEALAHAANKEEKGVFPPEYIQAIRDVRSFETSLEMLQAQEYVNRLSLTLLVMYQVVQLVESSFLSDGVKWGCIRSCGVFIPFLAIIDASIALVLQAFLLTTGVIRLITGRGPIYTECTVNPLMHLTFLIQNILKMVGNILGACIWCIDPMAGFGMSLFLVDKFFKLQMFILMMSLKEKMLLVKNDAKIIVPIVFEYGSCLENLSLPVASMHQTYMIVEKKSDLFNLFWVNRPKVHKIEGLPEEEVIRQVRQMLMERFPFMRTEKMRVFPFEYKKPDFDGAETFSEINEQSKMTNCVVSNLFAVWETMDKMNGFEPKVSEKRNHITKKVLIEHLDFYSKDFNPLFIGKQLEWQADEGQMRASV